MEFDLSIIILCAIFIVAIALPFWLLSSSIKKMRDQMKKSLETCSIRNSLNFSDKEIWNLKAIAIDTDRKKLVFISKGRKPQEQILDFSQIKGCKITKGAVGIPETDSYKVIKVDLHLQVIDSAERRTVSLPIFDVLYDDPVEGNFHLLLARRWLTKIQELMRSDHLIQTV